MCKNNIYNASIYFLFNINNYLYVLETINKKENYCILNCTYLTGILMGT